ncbi:hypothetical protein U1Q18_002084 [Sarracenia purpurea var. burkii]
MVLYKQKKNQGGGRSGGNRLLISITVIGSPGPIRFVVNEGELVAAVIETTLKSYAREGRLPILGSDLNNFLLYCPVVGTEALNPWETIGSVGVRNFMLCKKPQMENSSIDDRKSRIERKGNGSWKSWFNKSLNLKTSCH